MLHAKPAPQLGTQRFTWKLWRMQKEYLFVSRTLTPVCHFFGQSLVLWSFSPIADHLWRSTAIKDFSFPPTLPGRRYMPLAHLSEKVIHLICTIDLCWWFDYQSRSYHQVALRYSYLEIVKTVCRFYPLCLMLNKRALILANDSTSQYASLGSSLVRHSIPGGARNHTPL